MKHHLKHGLSVLACLGAFALPAFADEAQLLAEGREIPKQMQPKLLNVLQGEILKSGHASTILVCRDKATGYAE